MKTHSWTVVYTDGTSSTLTHSNMVQHTRPNTHNYSQSADSQTEPNYEHFGFFIWRLSFLLVSTTNKEGIIFGGMYGEAFRCLNESIVQAEPDLGQ
jgi:hypothetical protein